MVCSAPVPEVGLPRTRRILLFFLVTSGMARTIFRDVFAGVDPDLDEDQIEWGVFQKVVMRQAAQEGSSFFKHYVKNGKIITLVQLPCSLLNRSFFCLVNYDY